jgi:3'-5' exoribonuclease
MPRRYIAEMEPGEQIEDAIFVLADRDLRSTHSGGLYIHAVLRDRSGQVPARQWQATQEAYDQIKRTALIRVRGRTESYKGSLQVILDGFEAASSEGVDLAELLPASKHDIPEMWERVKAILRTIADPDLLLLMKMYVEDDALVKRILRAPAAIKMHHAYIGGLLEHTLQLMELARVVVPRYPELSLDLVVVGLFLHDLGKVDELNYDSVFEYSSEGQLVGHIAQGVLQLESKVQSFEAETGRSFPREKKWAIQHLILSHHGHHEFGAPRLPATPEAFAVHHLDVMDAKLNQALNAVRDDKDPDADWTSYIPALQTRLYKRDVVPEGN